MKVITYLIFALFFTSCQNENKVKTNTSETVTKTQKTHDMDILLTGTYRSFENENPVNSLSKDWIDLHYKDGKYYLAPVDYSISNGFDECTGDSTKILKSKNNTIIFIHNLKASLGEIHAVKIEKNKIWPNEKMIYHFNKMAYTLRAEGNIISSNKIATDQGEEIFHQVEDYKLYISTDQNKETLCLEESTFNDTFVEVLFVGDIDKDEKLDFIFKANRHYEEERFILYLSSKANAASPIKKVAEMAISFDC